MSARERDYRGRADSIVLEAEEYGFELHVTDDLGRRFVFNVHGETHALIEIGDELRRYWRQGREAAAEHAVHLALTGGGEADPD